MSEITNDLIEWAVHSFNKGQSTATMAKNCGSFSECDIERALHVGLERRRVQRVAEAIGANV